MLELAYWCRRRCRMREVFQGISVGRVCIPESRRPGARKWQSMRYGCPKKLTTSSLFRMFFSKEAILTVYNRCSLVGCVHFGANPSCLTAHWGQVSSCGAQTG